MSEWTGLTIDDHQVAHLTLDRPARRNALTRDMLRQLCQHVHQVARNPAIRLLTIGAEGPVFCAGMDLGEMQARAAAANAADEWRVDAELYRDLLIELIEAPFPVLAFVKGPVLAGGMGIVLACDIVLASRAAYFSLPEPLRGITAAMVTPLLAFRAAAGPASFLLLAGRPLTVEAAATWGLCHEVMEPEEFDEVSSLWVKCMLRGSPAALAASKANLRRAAGDHLVPQIRAAALASAAARETVDAREGLQAFLEKRRPSWQFEE